MERQADETGRALANVPRDEMEKFWNAAKKSERQSTHSTAGASPKK
jgi:hypothetical protein